MKCEEKIYCHGRFDDCEYDATRFIKTSNECLALCDFCYNFTRVKRIDITKKQYDKYNKSKILK